MTFYVALTLEQHVVVAVNSRWTHVDPPNRVRYEEKQKLWRVNDRTVATGSGIMFFVEAWCSQHLSRGVGGDPIALDAFTRSLPGLHKSLASDHANIYAKMRESARAEGVECEDQCTTIFVAGVGRSNEPFYLSAVSTSGFEPRLARGAGKTMMAGLPPEHAIVNEENVQALQQLGRMALSMPPDSGVSKVQRELPLIVQRVARVTDAVGPSGHIVVVSADGLRISPF